MNVLRKRVAGGVAATVLLFSGLLGLSPVPAFAATFVVNNQGDAAPAPANCVSGTGACTLRAAVMAADAASGSSSITLSAGTYALAIAKAGTDDASEGDLDITNSVSISGPGQGSTFIDGTAMKTNGGQDRIFKVAAGGTLNLTGVTIRNGTTPNSGTAPLGDGGGILSLGTLNVTDATISGNVAIHNGGGLSQQGSGAAATATVTRVTITGNTAHACAGGVEQGGVGTQTSTINIVASHVDANTALQCGGGVEENSGGTINISGNSTVSRNVASNGSHTGDVGGVYETGNGTINISDATIDGNSTDSQAGGVDEDGAGSLHMHNVVVSNNVADDSAGGIYLDGGSGTGPGTGTVTLDHLTITGNRVTGNSTSTSNFMGSGGGLNEDGGDLFSLTNSTVSNNTASHGAGIYLGGESSAATFTNVTISGNRATALGNGRAGDGFGGGMLDTFNDDAALTNVTISNNTASAQGGGLINTSTGSSQFPGIIGRVTVLNSTIADNTAAAGAGDIQNNTPTTNGGGIYVKSSIVSGGAPVNCAGTPLPVSQGYNIDSGSTCHFGAAGDQAAKDPMLGPLADNGGGLQTRGLKPGSPALDAIPSSVCPPPDTDERGVTRHADACDVGAFEGVLAAVAPTPSPTPALPKAGAGGPGGPPLRIALLLALTALLAPVALRMAQSRRL